MKKKVCFIVGTRPEIIKLGPVYNYFREKKHFYVTSYFTNQHTEIGEAVIKHFKFNIRNKKNNQISKLDLNSKMSAFAKNLNNYLKVSKNIKIVVQIETIKAINNLEEILKVKGIHSTLIGPRDLSGSISKAGDYKNKKFIKALQKYEKISKQNNVSMGIHIAFPKTETLNKFIKKGYEFIGIGTDMTFLGDAIREKLNKINK